MMDEVNRRADAMRRDGDNRPLGELRFQALAQAVLDDVPGIQHDHARSQPATAGEAAPHPETRAGTRRDRPQDPARPRRAPRPPRRPRPDHRRPRPTHRRRLDAAPPRPRPAAPAGPSTLAAAPTGPHAACGAGSTPATAPAGSPTAAAAPSTATSTTKPNGTKAGNQLRELRAALPPSPQLQDQQRLGLHPRQQRQPHLDQPTRVHLDRQSRRLHRRLRPIPNPTASTTTSAPTGSRHYCNGCGPRAG